MSAKKILFLVGDFAEDYEVMVPFQALTMLGHIVHDDRSVESCLGVFGAKPWITLYPILRMGIFNSALTALKALRTISHLDQARYAKNRNKMPKGLK